MSEKDDLFLIQVRLFRLAQSTWNLDAQKCSALFNKYDVYDYIKTCYGFFHIQGDEANLADIAEYLKNKGVFPYNKAVTNCEYEFGRELLTKMTASVIARKQKISKVRAFDKFIKSETARMLFDQDSGMWLNGPDYIADEYKREMYFKRTGKSLEN